jgi:hypothetical protein
LRAKCGKSEKIFTASAISSYVNSLLKKSPKFQSNVQVQPIMEGHVWPSCDVSRDAYCVELMGRLGERFLNVNRKSQIVNHKCCAEWVVNILGLTKNIKIPDWLDYFLAMPVLWYRRLRYGYAFRLLRMAQPRYAKVDPADYNRLRKYEWFASSKAGSCFYARRRSVAAKEKEKLIYLHREIIKVPDGMFIDHINHDSMDNRCANLRLATHLQNTYHRRKRLDAKTSNYKGVYWKKAHRKWAARIGFQKKEIHLGYFENEIDAALEYDKAAKKYHGEFACLNFPDRDCRDTLYAVRSTLVKSLT